MKCCICVISSGSSLFIKVKKIYRQKLQYFFENYNMTSLDIICTVVCDPNLIVSNQKEGSISKQRAKRVLDINPEEINKPVHEISNNVVCATSKASDQPAHMRTPFGVSKLKSRLQRII